MGFTALITGGTAALVVLLAACSEPTANQGNVSNATGQTPAAQQPGPAPEAPTWGKRYTWKDGLAVEVTAPEACKPSEYASPQNVQRAVKFTVTIVNGTDKPVEAATLSIGGDAQFDGKKAEQIFDIDGTCGKVGDDSGTVLPGKNFTYTAAYSVAQQPGEMQLTFQPNLSGDKAVYTGKA